MRAFMSSRRAFGLGVAAFTALSGPTSAQERFDVDEVVRAAADVVRAQYVDADVAVQLADGVMARLASGAYQTRSANELSDRLTADLRAATGDPHMVVRYEPPGRREQGVFLAEDDLEFPDFGWGLQTAARLPGNIGLLRTTHFPGGRLDKFSERMGAAMTLLQDTRALIVDLAAHHGGGSDAQGYFMSYFVDGEVELRRLRYRDQSEEIIRTSHDVVGSRYGQEKPIFVAVSRVTFSAGEGVATSLRQWRRARLVGRRTRGGGNAGNFANLPHDFKIFVVMGRGEPTWEGIGVAPDVDASPERALAVVYRLALQNLIDRETDSARAEVLRNVAARNVENLSSFEFTMDGR